jgi:glycosyltransferase involved in cell wall biosynthesis
LQVKRDLNLLFTNKELRLTSLLGNNMDAKHKKVKLCMISPQERYPAFDSVSSILREILGPINEIRLRISVSSSFTPSSLLLIMRNDISLFYKIVTLYKKNEINSVLFFQGYWPLTCLGLKIFNIKSIIYVGGDAFEWSYVANASSFRKRIFSYSNIVMLKICHQTAEILVTLAPGLLTMTGMRSFKNKITFALPRLDNAFFEQFQVSKEYKNRQNIIGYVGSLVKRKGILNLIRAFFVIRNECDYKLLIIGTGPLFKTIRDYVRAINLENRIEILGFIKDEELASYYNEMKLCVIPSYLEGIPSTIFEAMSCGTPVLATSVGAITDVITDGQTGFLIDSNNSEILGKKLVYLMNNPQLLQLASCQARKEPHRYQAQNLQAWLEIAQILENKLTDGS